MKMFKKNYVFLLLFFIIIVCFIPISQNNTTNSFERDVFINPQSSQIEFVDNSLNTSQEFKLVEIAENNETMQNISSVEIELGTSRWNVTELNLELSNMTFINETKTIEDNPTAPVEISKFSSYDRLAVQLDVNAETSIYGIYIYGQNQSSEYKDIRLQVGYYDEITGAPNGTNIRDISLNMTKQTTPSWHLQKFISPLTLSKGKYSIIINGDTIGNSPFSTYYWYYCHINPNYPNLNISRFTSSGWTPGDSGNPFLYKLNQRINETFFPSQINLTAEINNTFYSISNKTEIGNGNLSLSFHNFFPNTTNWNIPISNNISNALIFNLSYHIELNNSLSCSGSVHTEVDQNNIWTINPILDRFGYNYTIIYDYPNHWNDLKIYKNNSATPLASGFLDDGDYLNIYNESIPNDVSWEIEATSVLYNLTIDIGSKTSYNVEETLGFHVRNLPIKGTYIYLLIDSIGAIVHIDNISEPGGDILFEYDIPSNSRNGEWTAYVFWNNGTDAGMQIQTFTIGGGITNGNVGPPIIDSTEGIDPLLLMIILIVVGAVIGVSLGSYMGITKIRENREQARQKMKKRAYDILNLQDIIVIAKDSGLNVYEEHYSGRKVDATLISGFLDAIRSFGIELTGAKQQTQTISLEYKKSIVIMSEYKNFRLILIMNDKPSSDFLEDLNELSRDIEENYGEKIKATSYDTKLFLGIHDLILRNLDTSFISPLKIRESDQMELTTSERIILFKAKSFMKKNNLDYFFISFLIPEEEIEYEEIKAIFSLIERNIFFPIQLKSKTP